MSLILVVDELGVAPVIAVALVPAQNPTPPPGQGPEFGKASPVALVVILLLALATAFLVRSMTKRIRRLPDSFDKPADRDAEDAGDGRS